MKARDYIIGAVSLLAGLGLGYGGMQAGETRAVAGTPARESEPPTERSQLGWEAKAALPPFAREMREVYAREKARRVETARRLGSAERIALVREYLLARDITGSYWAPETVLDLQLELAALTQPEDIPALARLKAGLGDRGNGSEQAMLDALIRDLAARSGTDLAALAAREEAGGKARKVLLEEAVKVAAARDVFAGIQMLRDPAMSAAVGEFGARELFDRAGAIDPERALRAVPGLPGFEMRQSAYSSLLQKLAREKGLGTALEECERIPEPGVRAQAMAELLGEGNSDPKLRPEILEKVKDPELGMRLRKQTLDNLITYWDEGPAEALDWLAQNAETLDFRPDPRLWRRPFENLGRSAPDKALARLKDLKGTHRENAVSGTFDGLAQKDLERARQAMESLEPRDQDLARREILDNWTRRDPQAAAAYLEGLGEFDDRPKAVGAVVSAWASNRQDEAAAWLSREPAGPARDQGAKWLAYWMARPNLSGAVGWTAGIQEPAVKGEALRNLSQMASDPEALRTELRKYPAQFSEEEIKKTVK
jgi:hypothetical protein